MDRKAEHRFKVFFSNEIIKEGKHREEAGLGTCECALKFTPLTKGMGKIVFYWKLPKT